MIASSAFGADDDLGVLREIQRVEFAASCSETRSRLREARMVSAVNGASTRSTLPFGAMRPTTSLNRLRLFMLVSNASITAISPAGRAVEQRRLNASLLHLALIFFE
jgi:hypothetical protein